MTTRRKAENRFFDSLNETYDALLSALEATEARGHKVSQAMFEEARKGEREVADLARKWVETPGDVYDNLGAMVDAQARAQRRALELAREAIGGAGDYVRDVQDALERLIKANRTAADATIDITRDAAAGAVERVRRGAQAVGRRETATKEPVAAGNGAKE